MTTEKTCTKCGKKLKTGSPFETCTEHRTQEETRAAWAASKRKSTGGQPRASDADDELLDRTALTVKPPPPPKKVKKAEPAGDVEEFFRLAEALGLEPQEMLDGWCRDWVSKTRAKALAPTLVGETTGVELVPAEAPTGD